MLEFRSRRKVLRDFGLGAAALARASLTGCALSGREQSAVWLGMSQQELDDAYSQFKYAPNIRQVIARWSSNSQRVRDRVGDPVKYSYGPGAVESMDVFRADVDDAPVHIFVHGGAWQEGSAEIYAFPAELFLDAGIHYVVLDFSWIQDVGDSLFPIVEQLRRAVAWIYRNANRFGGDPDRLFVSGHSSGAHLAGVLLTTDWGQRPGIPADVLKGGMCCSGMYDLRPVRLSARGEYIDFTDEMERALSPIRHLERLSAPVIVAYGSYETPEFIRQSRDFANAANESGKPAELIVAENYNHFEVIETLANPNGILGRAVLDMAERI
jgi:arylformamidase